MSLARSFSIYTLSSFVAGAVPLLLLPVLTRYLSEADYGIAATMTTLVALFTPPLMWGTHALVSVEYHRRERDRFPIYFSSLLRLPVLAFGLLLGVALGVAWLGAERLQVPAAWIFTAPVFALLSALPQLQRAILRMRNEAVAFATLEVATAVASVALTLLFIVTLGLHWEGRLYALAVCSALMSAVAVAWLVRHGYLVAGFDRQALREAFKFGAGIVPHDLFNQAIRLADRLIIVVMAGLASAGQYAVAAQVTSVMLIALSAFNRAWSPYLFSRLPGATDATRIEVVRKSYLVMAAFVVFFVLFNAAVPLLYQWLIDPKFHPSQEFVPWLSLGYLFTAVYLTYVDYIFYEKKTHILSMITFVNMSTNLLLNYLLIGAFGALGAAVAFACTMFLVMVLAFVISRRLHPMPWFYWTKRAAP